MIGPPPRFKPDALMGSSADLVFFLTNDAHTFHTLAIGPTVGSILAVSDPVPVGGSAVFTVHGLKPGSYRIWCTIDSHAAEGMVGTLKVIG
jgi:plastocyanin